MSDCRFGVSPVNYPDPDPDRYGILVSSFITVLMIQSPLAIKLKRLHYFQLFTYFVESFSLIPIAKIHF